MWVDINQLKALREKNLTFPEKEGILCSLSGLGLQCQFVFGSPV